MIVPWRNSRRDRQDAEHQRERPATNAGEAHHVALGASSLGREVAPAPRPGSTITQHERRARRRSGRRTCACVRSLKISARDQAGHDGPPVAAGELEVDLLQRASRPARARRSRAGARRSRGRSARRVRSRTTISAPSPRDRRARRRAGARPSLRDVRPGDLHPAAAAGHDLGQRRLRDASGPCVMTTTSSAVCATSASTWLETRIARPSAARRAQEVAQPADALRVQAVGRLVEHEHARVAEQRRRQAEPLAHAERVAAGAPVGRVARARRARSSSSTRASAMPGGLRRARAGGCGRCGPDAASRRPARRPRCATGSSQRRRSGVPRTVARPAVGFTSPSSIRSVVVLPAPFGPEEADDPALVHGERQVVHRQHRRRSAWSARRPRSHAPLRPV